MEPDTPLPAIVAALKGDVYGPDFSIVQAESWLRWCVEEIERWKKAREETLDYSIAL